MRWSRGQARACRGKLDQGTAPQERSPKSPESAADLPRGSPERRDGPRKVPANARPGSSTRNRRGSVAKPQRGRETPASPFRLPRWWGQDSNLRRQSQRVYSPSPLTAREPHRAAGNIAPPGCHHGAMRVVIAVVAMLLAAAPEARAEDVLNPSAKLW